jgi:hypothetical protein
VTCKVIRIYRACVEFEKKLEEYSTGGMTTEEQYKSALIDVTQLLNLRGDNGTEDNLNIAKNFYLDPVTARVSRIWVGRTWVDR